MLSISWVLRKLSASRPTLTPLPEPVPSGMPSTTISGSLLALIEVAPRMRMVVPPPGSLFSTTCTPAALLWMSSVGVMMRPVLKFSDVTLVTAPMMLPACCSP